MPDTDRKRRGPLTAGEWAAIAFSLVVAGAVTFTWWRGHRPPPAAPPAATEPAAAPEVAAPPPPPLAATATPADVRAQLEPVSADPLFRRALAGDDVLARAAVLIDNLAEGVSPRRVLDFLAPSKPFTVVASGERKVIAPAAYARYDAFAGAVASVDAPLLARAYRALHPALETAYRALGYPQGALDRAAARALQRLVAAPVRDGEVAVKDEGGVFVFEDPALEALRPVEKHLLRMGPRNARLVQAKARELQQALGLPGIVAAPR
ncbi:DUF3014 domain-containing protein [Anaeromyxobacter oryzae]|uniref:DUF3014 domain-containing protein n=1 Tax=Anaeromyxobacter oryzae TaxID=2918170 RepID=A0ABM7WP85_9BACT|nr:DUF3014 domain-containing protein [Anaeromyxobacter oryzae]BDG01268.1 hypothetical protein AMOR_02640 [Anaeromyxobacter oryzae]